MDIKEDLNYLFSGGRRGTSPPHIRGYLVLGFSSGCSHGQEPRLDWLPQRGIHLFLWNKSWYSNNIIITSTDHPQLENQINCSWPPSSIHYCSIFSLNPTLIKQDDCPIWETWAPKLPGNHACLWFQKNWIKGRLIGCLQVTNYYQQHTTLSSYCLNFLYYILNHKIKETEEENKIHQDTQTWLHSQMVWRQKSEVVILHIQVLIQAQQITSKILDTSLIHRGVHFYLATIWWN